MQHLRSHCRRKFSKTTSSDPDAAEQARSLIGVVYLHEERIRKKKLDGAGKSPGGANNARRRWMRFLPVAENSASAPTCCQTVQAQDCLL